MIQKRTFYHVVVVQCLRVLALFIIFTVNFFFRSVLYVLYVHNICHLIFFSVFYALLSININRQQNKNMVLLLRCKLVKNERLM